jgi:hypothetical protein
VEKLNSRDERVLSNLLDGLGSGSSLEGILLNHKLNNIIQGDARVRSGPVLEFGAQDNVDNAGGGERKGGEGERREEL